VDRGGEERPVDRERLDHGGPRPELLIESRRRNLIALRTTKESARRVLQGEIVPCGSYLKCRTLNVVGRGLCRIPYLDFPNTLADTQRQHRHAIYQCA
jgi:hypothetical protein